MSWADDYFNLVEEDKKKKKKKQETPETFETSPYSAMGRLAAKASPELYRQAALSAADQNRKEKAQEKELAERAEALNKALSPKQGNAGLFAGLLTPLDDGWDNGDIMSIILEAGDRIVNNDYTSWAGSSAMSGLASFNKGVTSTADLILGKPLQALGWKNNPVSGLADYYSGEYDTFKANQAYYTEKLGGGAGLNFASSAVEGVAGAVPHAILALMTAGASLGETATTTTLTNAAAYQSGNVLTKAGMTVSQMMKDPQYWLSFAQTYGTDYEEAKAMGADDATAVLGATLTSLLNAGIEIGPDGASGIQGLPKSVAKGGKSAILEWAKSSVEEGGEEMLQTVVNNAVAKVMYDSDVEVFNAPELLEAGALGTIAGAALGGGQIGVQAGTNAIEQATTNRQNSKMTLSQNEQMVVDKVYEAEIAEREQNGKKLTNREKSKLYDKILEDMRKGYINTDFIEEVLGGDTFNTFKTEKDNFFGSDTFKAYKDALASESEQIKQIEDQLKELENEPNTIGNSKKYDALQSQLEELRNNPKSNELKAQLDIEATRIGEIKNQLRNEVAELTKDSWLSESYRELVRKNQKFQVDINQYANEKARKTIQNIIDSDLGDNSRQFHEFVDFLARISEDRDMTFTMTNNAKLKGTEHDFSAEGAMANGFINEAGDVVLNKDSAKALNVTVGHEVMHTFEGTEFYDTLKAAIKRYAIAKEGQKGWDKRIATAEKLYKNRTNTTAEAEVTNDLFGDYVFTDSEFIKRLSTEHRNIFQKIYDEIKYLCKIATAGSEEARELERVKREFERAWNETKAQKTGKTDAKYSLSPVEAVQPKSDKWNRTHTTEEAMARFPNMWNVAADESEVRNPTQITSTVNSYRKIYNFLQSEGFNGTILDASSGLGYGTRAGIEEYGFNVEDIEPYPDKGYKPKYQDYSSLDKKYDVIISNAVLNVLPQDQRDALAVKMGELLNDGGRLFVNVRGKDVESLAKTGKNIHLGNMEWIETVKGSYQKGFTKPELVAYLQDALGDGFTVKPTNMFGAVSAVVTKDGGVKYSLSDSDGKKLTNEQAEYFKDSKVRDENGNLKVMYHGSQDAGFHVFDPKMSDDDTSLFFVDRNDVAASYSGTTETYEAKTIRSAEDMNNFLAEIGQDEDYSVTEKDGQFILLYDGERVAASDTAQGIYKEFCWYEGVGEGDANYKVYLNLTNPLVVDAEGRNWDMVGREYSQSKYDALKSLTEEERAALKDLAEWEDFGVFKDELAESVKGKSRGTNDAYYNALASAYLKSGFDVNALFDLAAADFSEEVMRETALDYLNTRDYAAKAKAEGYDGVILKNIVDVGGYGGEHTPSTVAIAFDSNQVKSVANEKPTGDADIRYSISDAQNEHGLDRKNEILYSLSFDTAYMDKAIEKNNSNLRVDAQRMEEAKGIRSRIAGRMNEIKDRGLVGLPEDIEGNTYIANSSYDGTEENTTICPRSLASEAFVDAVSEYLGRPLTVEEQIYISQDLQGRSLTPECTYCYVATDRKAYRAFLGEYINQRDAVLQKVEADPNADVSRSGELYKEFLNGRKDTEPMYKRFKMWVDVYKNGTPMVDASHLANINKLMGDINSEFGAELKPQITDAMKYAQSASWAKKRVNYVAYNGHILNWKQDRINKLNSHYGLRMYSFSDFHPAFVLENMQMITDASVRGLKMLGYTKDTDFVEIFAPSGMNINVSTFGFEANGNVYENNLIGAEWEKAKALREQYPNVGVTFVATNDTLVDWALEQDWIDVVIPYHLVRTGTEVAKAFGYTNYTSESADTKTKEWAKGDKKSIAPTEHNNDLETYFKALEKNHLNPRFERFKNRPNYMKLVNECRQSASESKPVQPIFNEDAAMKALAKLEANGYYQPIGGSVERMYEIAAEVAEDMTSQLAPAMSLSNAGEQPVKHGDYHYYGKDIGVQDPFAEFAPVAETTAETKQPVSQTKVEDLFPDNYAPTEAEEEAWQAERMDSLTDADVPPEVEAPYYESEPVKLEDPFNNRDWYDIGNRKVKAYMYENPEVKPFFQMEAMNLLGELNDTTKGERWYNDELYYESGGEKGFGGVKRHTSASIEELLDSWHMSYADIEKGLTAIIEDNGAENIAAAKKLEFMLNDRLLHGYKDFYSNGRVPPSQEYINLLKEKQITEYNEEAYNRFMESMDYIGDYAPVAENVAKEVDHVTVGSPYTELEGVRHFDDGTFAPVKETAEKIAPPKKTEKAVPLKKATQQKQTSDGKTGKVIIGQERTQKKQSGVKWAREHVFRHGAVFEDLALETGNRELQARFDNIRRAESRAQTFIGKGKGNVSALVDVRNAIEKAGKTKAFNYYLYHMHNVDRMTLEERFKDTKNKAVFGDDVTAQMSREAAARLLKANPEFKRYANEIYGINKYLRQMLVEEGVISKETAELWETMYPHYVPISRLGHDGLNVNVPLDTNRTGVNAPIKKATGGNSDFYDVFDTIAGRIEQTYKAVAKNRFGVELKNTLGTAIESEVSGDMDEVLESMDNHEELLQEGKNGKMPTFTVFENGERVKFEITDEMYEAMKPSQFTYTNEVLKKVNNVRRNILTTYSPAFALTNPIKDVQDILLNSQHPTRTFATIPEAIKSVISKDQWYQERMENGGDQDTYFDSRKKIFKKEESLFKKAMGFVPGKIQQANEMIEQIPRMAEYIASRKMGRSIDVSMLDAARVTTNFGAPGDLTNMLNRNGFTFLGASVEGFNQQVRNVREAKAEGAKGWAKLAGKYLAAGLPALLLNHLLWDDDEEYEELSDYVKQNYYVIAKTENGRFIRIPKGRAVAVIQDAFRQMENLITGNDEADLSAFAQLVVNNLAPNNPLENNIIAPIAQAWQNKTWYGDDLVPTRLQDLPAAEQFDETTDSFSKWLGEATNISPYKWNYILDQYSGGVGDMLLPYLTPEADGGGFGAAFRDKFTVDPVLKNENVSNFYDTMDELTTNAKSSKATDEDILKYKYLNSVNSELSELYKQKREIQNDSYYTDEEKYELVREIQQEIVDLTRNSLNTYNKVTIQGDYARVGDRYYRRTDNGEWQKLTDKQVDKMEDVTSDLGIHPSEYWGNKSEYDFAYEYPEKYAVAKSLGGYESYKTYTSELYDIKADKDENGKSITGSRKEKVIDYVNSLDIDYGMRLIIFKSEYNADDTYNYEILDYLNSREDLSYEDIETILKELGFNVDSEGNVTWD